MTVNGIFSATSTVTSFSKVLFDVDLDEIGKVMLYKLKAGL